MYVVDGVRTNEQTFNNLFIENNNNITFDDYALLLDYLLFHKVPLKRCYFDVIIHRGIKENKLSDIIHIINDMINVHNIQPDVSIYNITLKKMIMNNDINNIIKIIYIMLNNNVKMDSQIINDFNKLKRVDLIFEEIERLNGKFLK